MSLDNITIIIVARNAGDTLLRCLRSIKCSYPEQNVLLIDDGFNEGLETILDEVSLVNMKVVVPSEHCGVGNARQTGLENVKTPFGVWLDADDEIIEGRLERVLYQFQEKNADLVYEAAELVDGVTQKLIKPLPIPEFLDEISNTPWLLDRNWFPVLFGGFKTEFARSIGFDRSYQAAEDYDLMYRSILAGANIRNVKEVGIKYYTSTNGVSRNRQKTASFIEKTLRKVNDERINSFLDKMGTSRSVSSYLLASRSFRLGDFESVIQCLEGEGADSVEAPPYGASLESVIKFLRASACFHLGDEEQAKPILEELCTSDLDQAAVYNNLGCCYRNSSSEKAKSFFEKALSAFPGYLDATINLSSESECQWTDYPLRKFSTNDKYLA